MRRPVLVALSGLVFLGGVHVATALEQAWKGAETFAPVTIGPNEARCGAFPRNVEARFAGSGIDTNGGPFAVTASGCLDTEAAVVSHLEATDTYARTGDAVQIVPADAVLSVNAETCVATNVDPVPFSVGGGTGRYANASGSGTYDLAFPMPGCAGPPQTVHVWFTGSLSL
jgi:hypothetical protein